MGTGIGSGLLEIAMAVAGIALVALILNKAGPAGKLLKDTSQAYSSLLNTVINPGSMSAGFTPMSF